MIPEHLVHELRYIELRAARRIRSQRVGVYKSPLRGEGFEFDQHQPYRRGDDARRIDWNATARTGTPFLRQMRAERELNMVLAGDLSRSMQLGSGRSKHEALVLATASLLISALTDGIRSGVLGFTDTVLEWTAPVSDKSTAWAAVTHLWTMKTSGKRTSIRPVLQHLLQTLKRTTLVVFVSDFLTDEDFTKTADLAVLASHHDVLAVVLEDPVETTLPEGTGYVRLRDVESDAEITVRLTRETRERYARTIQQRRAELQQTFYRAGVEHVFVNAQGDVVEPLMRVFEGRRS